MRTTLVATPVTPVVAWAVVMTLGVIPVTLAVVSVTVRVVPVMISLGVTHTAKVPIRLILPVIKTHTAKVPIRLILVKMMRKLPLRQNLLPSTVNKYQVSFPVSSVVCKVHSMV
jgi:hypothetical protein